MFDMVVNGGGYLTPRYQKDGFLTAQRQTQAPRQEFVWLDDVVMVPFDSQVSTIDLTSLDPIQIARGSVVVDGPGAPQATLLFRAGRTATLVKANGAAVPALQKESAGSRFSPEGSATVVAGSTGPCFDPDFFTAARVVLGP